MPEIEKKYMIKKMPDISENVKKNITQYYLYSDEFTAIRKRKIEQNEKIEYVYTVKTKGDIEYKNSINEIETEITEKQFYNLKESNNINEITKTRILIPIENDLIAELDIFGRNI